MTYSTLLICLLLTGLGCLMFAIAYDEGARRTCVRLLTCVFYVFAAIPMAMMSARPKKKTKPGRKTNSR